MLPIRSCREDPDSATACRCLESYFRELDGRFEGGFDAGRNNTATSDVMRPPSGLFVIAWSGEEACACAALILGDGGATEIKRMWVSPASRGRGVARRLVSHREAEARRHGMNRIRLDTNRALTEAHTLYASTGYAEVAQFNDNPYAHKWFEKKL